VRAGKLARALAHWCRTLVESFDPFGCGEGDRRLGSRAGTEFDRCLIFHPGPGDNNSAEDGDHAEYGRVRCC